MKRKLSEDLPAEDTKSTKSQSDSVSSPSSAPSISAPQKGGIKRAKKRGRRSKGQSRTVQLMEDYVSFVGRMIYPELQQGLDADEEASPYISERITPLGIVTMPLRRSLCVERWSPLEIATFESSLCIHGKNFHAVQKDVQTKTTKEIVEFYYLWKKTSHYKLWKKSYVPEELIYANDSDDCESQTS
mmetsp:Transcript_8858/g.33452  ORF Transcript_8858/g.33452 Transcript_8858/m.33452 type:complete len:187 (-) Transcript_8858:1353-1913(-)